jgi:hypothetical protein
MRVITSTRGGTGAAAVEDKRQIHRAVLESDRLLLALPITSITLWFLGLARADPQAMSDWGLLSLLGPANAASLVLLAAGVIIALHRGVRERLLALQLVTFLALIHAAPAILYGTLRYSWAWKHVGIVDYILRHGSVDPMINVSPIYQNWPGFFAASALLTQFAGRENLLTIASWAPFVFNLINLIVLRFALRGLTQDKRLVWLSLWFFFLINWVGQDYFSPQAMAYVLYLACMGLLIRGVTGWTRITLFALFVTAIAVSHQLTPIMLFIAVTGLVVLRQTPGWYLPIITAVVPLAWALTAARPYTFANFPDLIATFGQLLKNTNESLEKVSIRNLAQAAVVWGGRSVVVVSAIVAIIGVWRCWRNRTLQVAAALLMALPALLVVITGFGGEVLLRAFLFAAPFVAFNAATAIIPQIDGRIDAAKSTLVTAVLTAVLLPGFLLGYYGKERENYFTPAEVEATRWVSEHARPGSMLVEGSRNYPAQFRNYENFTYVPIDREPQESWSAIVANPTGVLSEWLRDPRYADSYVLITRSQEIEVDAHGPMPVGSLQSIESALRRSPEFSVAMDTGDATVFVLRSS